MASRPPTASQLKYLRLGRYQPGGKLPLFDSDGQQISNSIIRSCLKKGWVETWFDNPIKPDWLVCKLTEEGRRMIEKYGDRF
ncbi:MAG: hypothetical protein CMN55_15515 [Sneathiella sp.]|jgi:hypothetical protein|uniref:hypothetical protein n=1 Tax=Sneathiella sp. TaxID=1964365 RepID=UPI000C673DF2|nr:hypothetical protein [Sneathiella sp.]MAL80487.1 hypothetical protein [Sneathiella sp.]|tara:strand:- start:9 stop:254 length:246 start_codon:yes stop_codon:yes gene_type:complete